MPDQWNGGTKCTTFSIYLRRSFVTGFVLCITLKFVVFHSALRVYAFCIIVFFVISLRLGVHSTGDNQAIISMPNNRKNCIQTSIIIAHRRSHSLFLWPTISRVPGMSGNITKPNRSRLMQ
jgi:hypothetical protein